MAAEEEDGQSVTCLFHLAVTSSLYSPMGNFEGDSNKPLPADKAECFVKAFQLIDK